MFRNIRICRNDMNNETRIALICRLCGKEEKYLIDIFSDDGRKQDLEKKIRLCLPITVTLDDEMPRQVCLDCLNKLDAAFDLYTGCIEAQHYIREKLGCRRGPVPMVNCNGALLSGFLSNNNSIPGRNMAADNSLRNVLGLQHTFSSYVCLEQQRLEEENMQKLISSQKGILQPPDMRLAHSSAQYTNNMAQVNSTPSNGQLLGTQLDGTSMMIGAPNIPMMQTANSPVTGNIQGQIFASPLANAMSPAASIAPASVPVMGSSQGSLRSPAHMTVPCTQPHYPSQNNLPPSLQIMPVAQVTTGLSSRPSAHFAAASSSIFQTQHTSMAQNRLPLSQAVGFDGQLQQVSCNNMPLPRRLISDTPATSLGSSGTPSMTPTTKNTSSSMFNQIPSPSVSMPIVSAVRNTGQMSSPVGQQPQQHQQQQQQQQHMNNFMHQTVSLWMNKQNSARKSVGAVQSQGGPQNTTISNLSAQRANFTCCDLTTPENGSATVPLQPIITQVTSGFQNAGTVQPSQGSTAHLDLSNDTDDDMDVEPAPDMDGNDSENVKPFSLSVPTVPQKKKPRKRNMNPSAMEMCPHCQKEFRSDIIFHHIKLHFRQSFFSCLDCGKNYSSEKALEAHKCPGEV